MNKFKKYLIISLSALSLFAPMLLPANTYASDTIQKNLCSGVGAAAGSITAAGGAGSGSCSGTSTTITAGIGKIAKIAVNILSIIVGVVAVIMIIYGGFRYVTSGGESGSVSSAKNTLIYAIVGLVIVALAQFIVRWVLGTSSSIASFSLFFR